MGSQDLSSWEQDDYENNIYGFKKWHNLCNVQRLTYPETEPLLRCSNTVPALVISEITTVQIRDPFITV